MIEYSKANVKLSDTQLKKLKTAVKDKTGTTLRMSLNWCRNKKKKIHGCGTTALIIWNEEMNDIMKIVQALEDSNILLKGVTKTIKKETKDQKGGFLSMLLSTLGTSLLGHLLAGKRNCKSCFWKKLGFLMPTYPLTNFEIKRYFQNEPRFNGVFS